MHQKKEADEDEKRISTDVMTVCCSSTGVSHDHIKGSAERLQSRVILTPGVWKYFMQILLLNILFGYYLKIMKTSNYTWINVQKRNDFVR